VVQASYIGLGAKPGEVDVTADPQELAETWTQFERLIASYMDEEKGYTSRRAVYEERWEQDYDLLARWGEWDRTDAAHPTKVHLWATRPPARRSTPHVQTALLGCQPMQARARHAF
jgi:hypothetical protein